MRQTFTTDEVEAYYRASPAERKLLFKPGREPLTMTEHLLFLIGTVLTGGLALPFWIYYGMNGKPIRPA